MGCMILIKGQPGIGKSTVGRSLARRIRAPLVDKDDARNALQAVSEEHPNINWNDLSYSVMENYVGTQLSLNLHVVVDCPLARRSLFDRFAALAHKYQASIALIECTAENEAIWRSRIEARGSEDAGTHRSHKPGSWDDVQFVMRRNNGSEDWSRHIDLPCVVELDTTAGSTEEQVDKITTALKASGVLVDF